MNGIPPSRLYLFGDLRSFCVVFGLMLNREISYYSQHVEAARLRKQADEEKFKLEAQLQQAQKLESVGRLSGGVAHDFNNMLGVILGYAELALMKSGPTHPLHASLVEIHKAAKRSAELTRQLLGFARKQTVLSKVPDLNETVASVLKIPQRLIGENIQLRWQPEANQWPVNMDPIQIDQILANLCVNARDSIADVANVTIETGTSIVDQEYASLHAGIATGEYVRLVVSDDGCGMEQETIAHIFEPFFTTKKSGHGTGLGLATVYGIVKQNDGYIDVYSASNKETAFTIFLPRHVCIVTHAQTEGTAELVLCGKETILLVEDEPALPELGTVMLEMPGYKVLPANTPDEAIRLGRELAREMNLLITDVVMPKMNGRDSAAKLVSPYPNFRVLFMSGYPADVIGHQGVIESGVHFIQKPFSRQNLAFKIREVLDLKKPTLDITSCFGEELC